MQSAPPIDRSASARYRSPNSRATVNSRPLIHSRVASATVSKTISRQSALETRRYELSGSSTGRAPGFSLLRRPTRNEYTSTTASPGVPVEELVERFYRSRQRRNVQKNHSANALKEPSGSRISSTLRLWNAMNCGISRADSGESYFSPCLIDIDFKSLRAVRKSN